MGVSLIPLQDSFQELFSSGLFAVFRQVSQLSDYLVALKLFLIGLRCLFNFALHQRMLASMQQNFILTVSDGYFCLFAKMEETVISSTFLLAPSLLVELSSVLTQNYRLS